METRPRLCRGLLVIGVLVAVLGGCATRPYGEFEPDPLEPINRVMYSFVDLADRAFIEPVADLYVLTFPEPVRNGVSNFFDHWAYLDTVLNAFLQGKFDQGISDTGRFLVNSTIGLAGVFDVATTMGFEEGEEDFGQTLAVWGAGEGAYLFIPVTGPSTIRDALGIPVSWVTNPLTYLPDPYVLSLAILRVIDRRAQLKTATRVRDEAALDPYIFTREAYRQRRQYLIYDGNPPLLDFDEELDMILDEDLEAEEPAGTEPAGDGPGTP
jgi:phospholipid-binding lipoprotein MlaA